MKRKSLIILFLLVMCFALTGCYSEVEYFQSSDGQNTYYTLRVAMDDYEESKLNASVEKHHNGMLSEFTEGTAWTFKDYLKVLIERAPENVYKRVAVETSTSGNRSVTYHSFQAKIPKSESSEEDSKPLEPYKQGFYFYKYRVEEDSPFNGARSTYDNVASDDYTTLFGMIKNGWQSSDTLDKDDPNFIKKELELKAWVESGAAKIVNTDPKTIYYEVYYMPSFYELFPVATSIKDFNPDNLYLNFFLATNSKLSTTGEKVRDSQGNTYYLWQAKFDGSDNKIVYEFIRANSLGWNITAILTAFAVIGILLLVTKFKKKKPPKTIAKDLFPYDPFDYNGASNDNQNNNNPFNGY